MGATRFTTLDGMRGFAALGVMFYHMRGLSPVPMPGGYLAVDFFFALSGFVIANAYEPRLRDGLTLREFGIMRLIRIYPMYFVGACIAIAVNGGPLLSLYPLPEFRAHYVLFPANGPMWSLFFEIVVSLAFATIAPHLRLWGLGAIICVSGAILARAVVHHGDADLGALWADVPAGLARTAFSFAVGVAIYRARDHLRLRSRTTALAWTLPVVLFAIMRVEPHSSVARDLLAIFAIMPTLVWLGAGWTIPSSRVFRALGDLSYPLYCIHAPLVVLLAGPTWLMVGFVALNAGIALRLDHAFDRPVRAWLTRSCDRRNHPPATDDNVKPAPPSAHTAPGSSRPAG